MSVSSAAWGAPGCFTLCHEWLLKLQLFFATYLILSNMTLKLMLSVCGSITLTLHSITLQHYTTLLTMFSFFCFVFFKGNIVEKIWIGLKATYTFLVILLKACYNKLLYHLAIAMLILLLEYSGKDLKTYWTEPSKLWHQCVNIVF